MASFYFLPHTRQGDTVATAAAAARTSSRIAFIVRNKPVE